ncbi:hypothetical protein LshimejAT787_1103890 [Lyophyllum shimeji]|uniref:Uncharacterized protein n=1 Tax=Lyophyllum shimeji TaxID=47721 RepID=A0A9P3PVP5_LYOSH|nr:hypothetical protein LshimejAT787_1103890 [Lyophyllum shimeji]
MDMLLQVRTVMIGDGDHAFSPLYFKPLSIPFLDHNPRVYHVQHHIATSDPLLLPQHALFAAIGWRLILHYTMDNAMDDTKNPTALEKPKAPKQSRPPLTLDDIGEAPPLRNTRDPLSGKRVRLTVLAFPFPPKTQDEWAQRHKFALDMDQDNRRFQTILEVRERLPKPCRLGLVPYNGKRNIGCTAIIVTSNATPEKRFWEPGSHRTGSGRSLNEPFRLLPRPFPLPPHVAKLSTNPFAFLDPSKIARGFGA